MNVHWILIILLLMMVPRISIGAAPPDTPAGVKVSVELKQHSLKAGDTGILLITLKPPKGMHVNVKPPMSISFDSSGIVKSSVLLYATTRDTLLDTSTPVNVKFKTAGTLGAGTVRLKGTFIYYYCSDAEGWCSRSKETFDLPLSIVKK